MRKFTSVLLSASLLTTVACTSGFEKAIPTDLPELYEKARLEELKKQEANKKKAPELDQNQQSTTPNSTTDVDPGFGNDTGEEAQLHVDTDGVLGGTDKGSPKTETDKATPQTGDKKADAEKAVVATTPAKAETVVAAAKVEATATKPAEQADVRRVDVAIEQKAAEEKKQDEEKNKKSAEKTEKPATTASASETKTTAATNETKSAATGTATAKAATSPSEKTDKVDEKKKTNAPKGEVLNWKLTDARVLMADTLMAASKKTKEESTVYIADNALVSRSSQKLLQNQLGLACQTVTRETLKTGDVFTSGVATVYDFSKTNNGMKLVRVLYKNGTNFLSIGCWMQGERTKEDFEANFKDILDFRDHTGQFPSAKN